MATDNNTARAIIAAELDTERRALDSWRADCAKTDVILAHIPEGEAKRRMAFDAECVRTCRDNSAAKVAAYEQAIAAMEVAAPSQAERADEIEDMHRAAKGAT